MVLHRLVSANTEADWIRRTGVLIAITGAVAAAPDGTARLVRLGWAVLGRLWRRNSRSQSATVPGLAAAVTITAHAGRVDVWGGSTEEKLDLLRMQVQEAYGKIETVERQISERVATLRQETADKIGELHADAQALRKQLDAEERRATRVDSLGVAVIALGVVLTGVPDGLASVARLGWTVTALALAGTVFVGVRVWRDMLSA